MSEFSVIFAFAGGGTIVVDAVAARRWRVMGRRSAVVVAGVVLIGVAGGVIVSRQRPRPEPLHDLVSAVPEWKRPLEVRVTGGFPWRPFASPERGSLRDRAAQSSLEGAATNVARELEGKTGAEALHARGLAYLLAGRTDLALQSLEGAAQADPKNGRVWSDIGSARYAAALAEDEPIDLPLALAATDHALRLNAALPEALFNRAVVLERMGLRHLAANAWRSYLAVDAQSDWANEARQRLARASVPPARLKFRDAVAAIQPAAVRGDMVAIRAFVAEYQQLSRASCETDSLGRWADAAAAGNETQAAAELAFARAVGEVLQSASQETLLREAVAAVEGATGASRQALIEGHQVFREGRMVYSKLRAADAEPMFRQAAARFTAGSSPMADVAQYYLAQAIYDQQRVDEARALLLQLKARIPGGSRSLDAQVEWQLGLTESVMARWSDAFARYGRARAIFEGLGESGHLGFMKALQASTHESVGDREQAWRERVAAFGLMSDDGSSRLPVSLGAAGRAELQAGRLEAAASLLQLVPEAAPPDETTALAYGARAEVAARLGDQPGAERHLADARATAANLKNEAARIHLQAMLRVSEAAIRIDAEPARALTLLAEAERHYEQSRRRFLLPDVYLQRGRALRRLGRGDEALAAITAGIAELEAQRAAVTATETRWSVLDAGEGLFAEALDLLTQRSDFASAFAYAERWRARTIRESVALRDEATAPSSLMSLQASLPPDALLLEYAVLEDRLVIFAVTRDRFETFVHRVTRADLRRVTDAFTAAVREVQPISEMRHRAAEAYELLLTPASSMLSSARTVIIAPDRFLQLVPYGALFDAREQRYLIQEYEVAITPAAHMLPLMMRVSREVPSRDAFVVGEPETRGAFEPLPDAEREARRTAALYAMPAVTGTAATRELFLRNWGDARVVHFAGHATSEPSRGAAAALAFSGRDGAEFLHAHEIARLRPRSTALVVLAACETFAGTKEHLEGTQTLAHAFLSAGVPAVVGTLWSIEDAPAQNLFSSFHRNYVSGRSAVSALRQAQLDQLASEDERARHPVSWAGVEVVGHPWQTFTAMRRRP